MEARVRLQRMSLFLKELVGTPICLICHIGLEIVFRDEMVEGIQRRSRNINWYSIFQAGLCLETQLARLSISFDPIAHETIFYNVHFWLIYVH